VDAPPGAVSWVQVFPFQLSISAIPSASNWPKLPTATHEDVEVQATPVRMALSPAGVTALLSVQLVPLNVSASELFAKDDVSTSPTATHEALDLQESETRLFVMFLPFALATSVHVVPFNVSARVVPRPELELVWDPTALHDVDEKHDTAARLAEAPAGFGVDLIAQVVPFHSSISVRLVVLLA
jgi:hypothetical protein